MKEEGYIKFSVRWKEASIAIDKATLDLLNSIRQKLREQGWLGVLPDGIGFGNISIRQQKKQFIISGSGTGALALLSESHLALVTQVDIEGNQLSCTGLTRASSESMSHAVCYRYSTQIGAVIHIHNRELWEQGPGTLPVSSPDATYGTPEMALSIERLLKQHQQQSGIIVMGGHQDGLISFGRDLEEAYQMLVAFSEDNTTIN
ncbi:class II aldolase/adducin family protein [Roseimarinus sediminis]|uniref:class II aldolase/adducin family protein n=1 Tax=Roseimarinus sediminis TaxID=1610899 RepID=UPI003D19291D